MLRARGTFSIGTSERVTGKKGGETKKEGCPPVSTEFLFAAATGSVHFDSSVKVKRSVYINYLRAAAPRLAERGQKGGCRVALESLRVPPFSRASERRADRIDDATKRKIKETEARERIAETHRYSPEIATNDVLRSTP